MMKFWKHVEACLNDIEETGAYYVGSTLSLPLTEGRAIALNLDGIGFVMNDYIPLENPLVYQPKEITELVREVYLLKNGYTETYQTFANSPLIPEFKLPTRNN